MDMACDVFSRLHTCNTLCSQLYPGDMICDRLLLHMLQTSLSKYKKLEHKHYNYLRYVTTNYALRLDAY